MALDHLETSCGHEWQTRSVLLAAQDPLHTALPEIAPSSTRRASTAEPGHLQGDLQECPPPTVAEPPPDRSHGPRWVSATLQRAQHVSRDAGLLTNLSKVNKDC